MYKLIEPSWDFGIPCASLIKVASDGLRTNDMRALTKRAGHDFAVRAKTVIEPASGEEYVHLIALGALEYYGPNRKGDAFPEDVCRKYHKTFEKYAKCYREHDSKNPKKSYGVVKAAWYDENKKRVDLIVALNATKKAADKNEGEVADEELELLYSGKPYSVSMACWVSHDICSGCGNKAKTRRDYCTAKKCVKYGGCDSNLGKTFEDGHTLHVINPDPIFFDISKVRVPADRIAYTIGVLKTANVNVENLNKSGIESVFYKQQLEPMPIFVREKSSGLVDAKERNALRQLVHLEYAIQHADSNKYWPLFCSSVIHDDPHEVVKIARDDGFSYLTSGLARQYKMLTPRQFASAVRENPHQLGFDSSSVFTELWKRADFEEKIFNNQYFKPTNLFDNIYAYGLSRTSFWDFSQNTLDKRLAKVALNNRQYKSASKMVIDPEMACMYGLYQLAWLKEHNFNPKLCELVVCANKAYAL